MPGGCRVIHADEPEDVVRLVKKESAKRMAISSDGRWVAVTNESVLGATVFNAITGQRVADLLTGSDGLPLFSPDNRWLATSSSGVRIWRLSDWQLATELHTKGKTLSAQEIAFSPDGRVLAVGQPGGVIRLSDPATGEDWAALTDPDQSPGAFLAFSPDQSKLVAMAASEHDVPRIWDLAAIRRELAMRGLGWPQDVLRTQANTDSFADSTRLSVRFEIGSFLKKVDAVDLLREADGASPE